MLVDFKVLFTSNTFQENIIKLVFLGRLFGSTSLEGLYGTIMKETMHYLVFSTVPPKNLEKKGLLGLTFQRE